MKLHINLKDCGSHDAYHEHYKIRKELYYLYDPKLSNQARCALKVILSMTHAYSFDVELLESGFNQAESKSFHEGLDELKKQGYILP